LCVQLVYDLHVSHNAPTSQDRQKPERQDRQKLERSLRIGLSQLRLLMLALRALRQQHHREGRNVRSMSGSWTSADAPMTAPAQGERSAHVVAPSQAPAA
jgi:hypothetical protein